MTTILLVDDDPPVLEVLADFLAIDFTVLTADSGESALPIIQSDTHIDVLVSDVMMPGISGIALATAARVLRPNLRVVMISGSWALTQMPEDYNFLPKPFRLQELHDAVDAAMREPA